MDFRRTLLLLIMAWMAAGQAAEPARALPAESDRWWEADRGVWWVSRAQTVGKVIGFATLGAVGLWTAYQNRSQIFSPNYSEGWIPYMKGIVGIAASCLAARAAMYLPQQFTLRSVLQEIMPRAVSTLGHTAAAKFYFDQQELALSEKFFTPAGFRRHLERKIAKMAAAEETEREQAARRTQWLEDRNRQHMREEQARMAAGYIVLPGNGGTGETPGNTDAGETP